MNALVPAFWQAADVWGESIFRASLVACIAIAVAWAIARWCTFLSPRVVCWIWRLACLKVLVALVWIQPVDIGWLPAHANVPAMPDAASHAIADAESPPAAIEPEHPGEPALQAERFSLSRLAAGLLLPAWLIGVVYCISRTARQWDAVRRLRSSSQICTADRALRMLQEEGQRLGTGRLPRLGFSSQVESPLLVGLWRPTIILPAGAEEQFDETELRLMIAHELAHLGRRDLAWNWLPTVAAWLFFFHPLVWVMIRRWSEAQEAACDEILIQGRVARPADYGRLLVKLSARSPLESHAPLAVAGVLGAYRNLERRILAMTRVKPFSARRLSAAACLVLLSAAVTIVPWRLVAEEPKADEAKNEFSVPFQTYMLHRQRPRDSKIGVDPASDRALERLRELGATAFEQGDGLLVDIQHGWKGTDADLALLADLAEINQLDLDFNFIGAEAVGKLKLKRPAASLALTNLSDERVAALAHLPACKHLILPQQTLSAKGFGQLAEIADGVELLIPALTGDIDDEKLAAIGKIRSLKTLQLQEPEITDAGLAHLANLDNLQELWLMGCMGVHGPGYADLSPIKSLRTLKIFDAPIDAAGFRVLATLTQLTHLELWPGTFPSAGSKPTDIEPLASLTNLESFEVTASDNEGSTVAFGDAVLSTAVRMPALRRLRILDLDVDAAGLTALARAPHLEELFLGPIKLSDQALTAFGNLKDLKKLRLMSSGMVTPAAWEKLGRLRPLSDLWASNSGIDDRGLGQLASLTGLEALNLSGNKITGTGLKPLTNLKQLRTLTLRESPLGDEGGQALGNFPAIEFLDLSKTKITDRSLAAIAALPNLRTLTLDFTQVTAEGLMKLHDLKQLSRVSLAGVKLSAEELARLNAAMPEVQIFAPNPTASNPGTLTAGWGAGSRAGRRSLDEALAMLEKAREKEPSPAVCRAAVLALRQNLDQATDAQKKMVDQWLSEAIQEAPDSLEVKLILADLRDMEGRFDDSAKLYRELLARPDVSKQQRAVIQNNLAYILATRGGENDLAEARALIDDAVAQLGPIGGLLDTRGLIHLAQGDAKAAVADFKVAVAHSPTAINYFHLALAEDKSGNAAGAAEAFQKAEERKLDVKLLTPGEQRDYQRLKKAIAEQGKR